MNNQITCTVDSCRYYAQGDKCEADRVLVNAEGTQGGARMEVGGTGGSSVNTSSQTRCDTFRPR